MAEKRYYWLKLKEDFFDQKEIKKLRRIAGGDTYTIIYLKMLLLSIKNGGKIMYEAVEDSLAEELSLEIDEDAEDIAIVLGFLERYKLIEKGASSEYLLPEAAKAIGSESKSAERVRRFREKNQALQCNGDVTDMKRLGNENVTLENREKRVEIDKEIDSSLNLDSNSYIDREGENETTTANARHVGELDCASAAEAFSLWEKNIGVISPILSEKIRDLVKEVGYAAYSKAVNKAVERGKCNFAYISATAKGIAAGNDYDKQPKKGGRPPKNDVVGAKNAVLAMLKGEST